MIYLDNNTTTPLHPKVKERIVNFSIFMVIHLLRNGRFIKHLLDKARNEVASFFKCLPEELIFTASGSEANNMVLKSFATCCGAKECNSKINIISTVIEHPSVKNTLKCLESQNVEVTYLKVDQYGRVSPDDLRKAIKKETTLISIMYANNEIGTVQPIEELLKIAQEHNIPFHTDAVQAVGKIPIDLQKLKVDYLTLSGHKIYAPKGVGIMFKEEAQKNSAH